MSDYPEDFDSWSQQDRDDWFAAEEALRKERLRQEEAKAKADKRRLTFKNIAAFCAEYVPLSYTVEGIVRSSSLYCITARTGAGKTSFNVVAALAVATGRTDILGREVAKGRVAFLAFENPDDVRMRFKIAAYLLNIDLDELGEDLVILDRRDKPEAVIAELARLAKDGPFALVIIETLAAFFDGKDINDAVEGGEFMRRLRPLTQIGGLPSVIVSAHPVKNAAADALIPYGSGAILNEVDGNLTLWKTDAGVSLHWQGKLRGIEFDPPQFRFEITGSPDMLDVKGRQVQLPTLRPSDAQTVEDKQRSEAEIDLALMLAIIEDPSGTQQDWARAIGRAKSSVNGRLQKLGAESLVEPIFGKWIVTTKGQRALKKAENPAERRFRQDIDF